MGGWALNWPKIRQGDSSESLANLRKIIYEELKQTKGIDEYFKMKNTINFYDYVNKGKRRGQCI